MATRPRLVATLAVLALTLGSCGGGSGGGPAPPASGPAPTAKATPQPAQPTPAPAVQYTSFPIPYGANSLPADITAGPNSDLWFYLANLGSIARITTSGVFSSIWKVPIVTTVSSLVTGPDNKLWYGDETQIVQLDPTTGIATSIALGSQHNAYAITVGPDGKLWWTDGYGYLSTMPASILGKPTTWALPNNEKGAHSITVGPDHNIWFVEGSSPTTGARVLSYNTSGKNIIDTALPNDPPPVQFGQPWDPTSIVSGPDGNIWITETAANFNGSALVGRILKIDTTGSTLGKYLYNTNPGEGIGALALAPNGFLYAAAGFSIANGAVSNFSIAEIAPSSGTTKIISLSPLSGPSDLTLGPDKNIWTAEVLGNGIGRLQLHD